MNLRYSNEEMLKHLKEKLQQNSPAIIHYRTCIIYNAREGERSEQKDRTMERTT